MSEMLHDIRVVEFSDGCSAAFCGRLFARLGADVVLVERPRTGSALRWEPPFLDDRAGVERGGLFMFTAAGKRSITLDAASPDGAAILGRLLECVDVLIDDRALATDHATAERTTPRLVRLAFRHFTAGGPYEKWLATELQLAALGGWMSQLGEPRRTPLVSNSRTMTAFVPGVIGAIAALAAVQGARQNGRGSLIDVAAQEALLFTTRFNETFLSYTGIEIKRAGDRYPAWAAYRTFKAADGDVTAAAATDAQIEKLMEMAASTIRALRRARIARRASTSSASRSADGAPRTAAKRFSNCARKTAYRWARSTGSTRSSRWNRYRRAASSRRSIIRWPGAIVFPVGWPNSTANGRRRAARRCLVSTRPRFCPASSIIRPRTSRRLPRWV